MEQSNSVFGSTSTIEKTIPVEEEKSTQGDDQTNTSDNSNNTDSKEKTDSNTKTDNEKAATPNIPSKKPNFLKRVLGTSSFVETLQKYLLKAMQKISDVKDFSSMATGELKKNIKIYS